MYRIALALSLAVWLCASCTLAVPSPEACQVEARINCDDDDDCFFGGVCDPLSELCVERTPCDLDLLASDATYDARRLEVNSSWFDDDFDLYVSLCVAPSSQATHQVTFSLNHSPIAEYYNLFYGEPKNVTDGCSDLTTPFPIPFYGTEYNEITICVEGFIQLGGNTLYEDGMTDSTPDCPITDVAPRILVGHGDWELLYIDYFRDVDETESTEGHEDGLQYWFMPLCQELPEYGACIKVKWNNLQPQTGDDDTRFDWSFYAWIYENGVISTVIDTQDDDDQNDLPTGGISMGLTSGDGDVLEILCDTDFYEVIGNFYTNITQNGGEGFGVIYYPNAPFTPDPEEEDCQSLSSLDVTIYCPGNNDSFCLFGGDCMPHSVANRFDVCEESTTASVNAVADSVHYVARELVNSADPFLAPYYYDTSPSTEYSFECGNITLDFAFPFFNTLYTTMSFCTSGYLEFGDPSGDIDVTPTCPVQDEGPRILSGHSDWGAYMSSGGVILNTYTVCPLFPEYGKCIDVVHKFLDPDRSTDGHAQGYANSFVTLYENGAILSHFRFPQSEYTQPGNLTIGLTSGDGEVLDVLCNDSGDAHYSTLVNDDESISLLYEPLWHNEYVVTTSEDSPTNELTNLDFQVTLTCGRFFKNDQLVLTNAVLVSVTEVSAGVFDVVVDAINSGVVTVGVRDTTLSVADSASITVVGVVEGTIEVQNAQGEVGNTSFFGFTLDTPIIFHITFESPFDLTALDLSASNGTIVGIVEGHSSSKKKKRSVDAPSLEWTVFVHPDCDGLVTLTYLPTGSSASANYIACLASLVSP